MPCAEDRGDLADALNDRARLRQLFEGLRSHLRQLDLVDPAPPLLAQLQHVDLPHGVEIEMAG